MYLLSFVPLDKYAFRYYNESTTNHYRVRKLELSALIIVPNLVLVKYPRAYFRTFYVINKKECTKLSTLHKRIIDLCTEKGVSGSRMCLDLGLSKSTLSDMKHGRTKGVSTATAQKIASYLDVSVGYLLGEEEKEEKPTVNDDELSENIKKLVDFAKSVPEDKVELVLKVMQSIVEAD